MEACTTGQKDFQRPHIINTGGQEHTGGAVLSVGIQIGNLRTILGLSGTHGGRGTDGWYGAPVGGMVTLVVDCGKDLVSGVAVHVGTGTGTADGVVVVS